MSKFSTPLSKLSTRAPGIGIVYTPMTMRYRIQFQLLVPMLLVILLAITISSVTSAVVVGSWVRRNQYERLDKVVLTLSEASFPLTQKVLDQMRGLSGAEFVVLDLRKQPVASTLRLTDADERALRAAKPSPVLTDWTACPSVVIAGVTFLLARIELRPHPSGSENQTLFVLYPERMWWVATWRGAWPPLVSGAIAAAAAVAMTTLLARRFVRPIQQLSQRAASIADGDFSLVEVPARDDEIRDLTTSINRMTHQLSQLESRIRQSERLRTLGQIEAGLSHQLCNWTTGARMAAQVHQRECPLGKTAESLDVTLRQLSLMESYLQRFLRMGQPHAALEKTRVCLAELIEDTLPLVQPVYRHANVRLVFEKPSEPVEVYGDREALRQLLLNLLLNGMQAASARGATDASRDSVVQVELERTADGSVSWCVLDTGDGPPSDLADKIFEPFVSDKPDGTGLGLSVAQQIASAHGASLTCGRQDGMTCFAVRFPAP